MTQNRQRGFSLVLIVGALVAVVVIGIVAWRIYESGKTTNQTNSQSPPGSDNEPQQQSGTPAADPNEGYVVLKEWGVRFKPVEGLGNVTHFRPTDTPQGYDRFDLSTTELGTRDARCATMGFSSVTRATTPQSGYETMLAQVGDYYYYYRGSDSACSTTAANATFEAAQRNLTKESLKTLEAVK